MIRLQHHPLGPRCFVLGVRAHEWHVGLAGLGCAGVMMAFGGPVTASLLLATLGLWLVATERYGRVPDAVARACRCTWSCAADDDHANFAGYGVIARAVGRLLDRARRQAR